MLFKESSKEGKKDANIAYFVTFVFWGIILFINSIFETFFNRDFISNSWIILISGLIIFFITDYLNRMKRESKRT
jgi:tetrahydromethanopterin S-methyltransferase subunit E